MKMKKNKEKLLFIALGAFCFAPSAFVLASSSNLRSIQIKNNLVDYHKLQNLFENINLNFNSKIDNGITLDINNKVFIFDIRELDPTIHNIESNNNIFNFNSYDQFRNKSNFSDITFTNFFKNPGGVQSIDYYEQEEQYIINLLKNYVNSKGYTFENQNITAVESYWEEDLDPYGGVYGWSIRNLGYINQTFKLNSDDINYEFINKLEDLKSKLDMDLEFSSFDYNLSFSKYNGYYEFYSNGNSVEFKTNETAKANLNIKKVLNLDKNDFIQLINDLNNEKNKYTLEDHKKLFNLANENQKVLVKSDTLGNLNTECDLDIFIGGESNIQKIQNKLNTLSKTFKNKNFEYKFSYRAIPNKVGNMFSVARKLEYIKYKNKDITSYLLQKLSKEVVDNNFINTEFLFSDISKRKLLKSTFLDIHNCLTGFDENINNIETYFLPSNIYFNYGENNFKSRLKISYGKIIKDVSLFDIWNSNNFDINNQLMDDKPIRLAYPKDGIDASFGGKYLISSPAKVNFTANLGEDEVLFINKNKIDVLNREFYYDLKDLRKSATDDEKVPFDEKDQNLDQDKLNEENSHKKNEYVIEIKKYAPGSNNTGEPIGTYKIILVIASHKFQQSFKWFAWDPENNSQQKELIEPFLLDEKGDKKVDENGNFVKNPKYDSEIDPKTGTKKQLIWIPQNVLHNEIAKKLKFWYPKIEEINDFGIFAEASVLGKGALRNLFIDKETKKKNTNINYFRIKLYDKFSQTFIKPNMSNINLKIDNLSFENGESQHSYMSEEGIWLIGINTKNSISNLQLVMIDSDNKPNNYFYDELFNKKEISSNKNLVDLKFFEKFWTTKMGKYLKIFIINNSSLNENDIEKLSYDEVLEFYNELVGSSWQYADKPKIDKISNIFNDIIWSDIPRLNGLTDKKKIEEIVLDYVRTNMNQHINLDLVENRDWYINEFINEYSKEQFINKLSKVSILGSSENKTYKGIKLTLYGKNKYISSQKEIIFKNEAWHVYEPPINLETLDIQNSFSFQIDKKTFEKQGLSEDQVDLRYRNAIKAKVYKLISDELLKYKEKTKLGGKEIEIILNKDIKIENEDSLIALLMRGKAIKEPIKANLKGINDNLLNKKEIIFQNKGDGGKFNLKNLSFQMNDSDFIIKESDPLKIAQKVIEYINEKAKALNLEPQKDFMIFAINEPTYWFELVMKYDDPRLDKNPILKQKILKELNRINEIKTIDVDGKIINIDFNPKDKDLLELINKSKEQAINNLNREIINKRLNELVLDKMIIIMPTQETHGFGHKHVLNRASKNYNAAEDKKWEKEIDNPTNPDPKKLPDKENNKPVYKKWWFGLIIAISIIGTIIGAVFLVKFLLAKYGWTFGKRKQKIKKISLKKETSKKQKNPKNKSKKQRES